MAISAADADRVNRVLTTTLDRYSPNISNEIKRNDGVITVFSERGRIIVAGGQRAIETLDVAENPNFAFRSRYTDVPVAKADTRTQAKYAWATIDGAVTINKIDELVNMGESKIYDLVESDVENAKNTMVRKIADALRASSPGSNDPESILTIIQDNAGGSQTGSTGEISRTSNTYWRNQYLSTSIDLSGAGLENLIAFILDDVAKGTSKLDKPDFGLTTGTLYAALAYNSEQYRRFGAESKIADLGFDNIVVEGATIIPDPSITSGDLYLINTNHMKLQVLKSDEQQTIGEKLQSVPVSVRPFMNAFNSLHSASIMYTTFALTASSLQRQGIATACS